MRAKKQVIDFYKNEKDFAVIYYAGIGLSSSCIQELTGFTKAQVDKRLEKAGIRFPRSEAARFIPSNHQRSGIQCLSRPGWLENQIAARTHRVAKERKPEGKRLAAERERINPIKRVSAQDECLRTSIQ